MSAPEPLPAPREAELVPFPASPDRRLRLALRRLDAALAEQREAMIGFRLQLAALGVAVQDLGGSAAALRDSLGVAAAEAARAHATALEAVSNAEALEARCR